MRQVDAALRVPDDLGSLECCLGHQQRLRIGVANVFRRVDEHAPRNVFRVFPAVDHAGKPVQRRIGIGTAHGFDKRGYDVVMHILVLIVRQSAMRRGAFHLGFRDNRRLLTRTRLLHARRKFKRGKRRTPVPARQKHDGAARRRLKRVAAVKPTRVGHSAVDQTRDIAVGKPVQLHHARTADKRRVHFEKRVFCSSAH